MERWPIAFRRNAERLIQCVKMFASLIPSPNDPLMRYAGLLARLSVTPLVVIWLKDREPVVYAGLHSARKRILDSGDTLDRLGASVVCQKRLVRIDDARKEDDRTVADLMDGLGAAMLAYPVMHAGRRAGCVMVIDDVARTWFSVDEHAVIEIAAEVSIELEYRDA